ncbi:10658_t:CDS:2 [Ambispora leptoticha]|uniref:10658_t:CDS:1 n=1 Tax=Ambispora leptoticha TaxID=144679 RepID=A0A9N8WK55_9GLOM|nr:10658_t:CDS:2 [Ambispora leptoticha]
MEEKNSMPAYFNPTVTLSNTSTDNSKTTKESSKRKKRAIKLQVMEVFKTTLGLLQTRKLRKVDMLSVFTPKNDEVIIAKNSPSLVVNDNNNEEVKSKNAIKTSTTKSPIKSTTATTINDSVAPAVVTSVNPTIARPKLSRTPTTELPPNSVIVHEDHVEYLLEPLHPYLLLGTHDVITPLSTDSFTCPKCHAPHAVHYVHEDSEKGYSKDLYICLVNGLSGCGWEDTNAPVEEDTHSQIKASIGFKPLILN